MNVLPTVLNLAIHGEVHTLVHVVSDVRDGHPSVSEADVDMRAVQVHVRRVHCLKDIRQQLGVTLKAAIHFNRNGVVIALREHLAKEVIQMADNTNITHKVRMVVEELLSILKCLVLLLNLVQRNNCGEPIKGICPEKRLNCLLVFRAAKHAHRVLLLIGVVHGVRNLYTNRSHHLLINTFYQLKLYRNRG